MSMIKPQKAKSGTVQSKDKDFNKLIDQDNKPVETRNITRETPKYTVVKDNKNGVVRFNDLRLEIIGIGIDIVEYDLKDLYIDILENQNIFKVVEYGIECVKVKHKHNGDHFIVKLYDYTDI